MNNVSIGKYIPGDSLIHKLNPVLKLVANIVFIVLVFLVKSFILEAIIFTPVLLSFFLSKLRWRQLLKMLKPVIFIGIFLFVINLFILEAGPTNPSYGHWWKLDLTHRAITQTLLIMSRIYIMIIITTLLTATTKPMALTSAIETILLPLKLIKVPVHIIAMIISIALRFVPTLLEEAQRIMKAQASRGVDFKNGGIKAKAKSMITLIIPLFVSAFAKAEDLGNAMETRGYNPYEKRTKYRTYPLKMLDVYAATIIIGLIVAVALYMNGVYALPTWIR